MLSNRQFARMSCDLWPKHVAHQIAGSQQDTASAVNALELAGRATGDHVELPLLVGEPHGGGNAHATFAKGCEEHKLVGRQGSKGGVHLFLLLLAFGTHALFLSSCRLYFVNWRSSLVCMNR